MKHLNGKRIIIWDANGHRFEGLCTGASDDIVKLIKDGETDERCFFVKNIFSYSIVGEGTTGGYSGLKVYVCKNESINCSGKCLISSKECHITDMTCQIPNSKDGLNMKCDFGCIGAVEVIPSKVKKTLFEGMAVDRNKKTNYLERAEKEILNNKEKAHD